MMTQEQNSGPRHHALRKEVHTLIGSYVNNLESQLLLLEHAESMMFSRSFRLSHNIIALTARTNGEPRLRELIRHVRRLLDKVRRKHDQVRSATTKREIRTAGLDVEELLRNADQTAIGRELQRQLPVIKRSVHVAAHYQNVALKMGRNKPAQLPSLTQFAYKGALRKPATPAIPSAAYGSQHRIVIYTCVTHGWDTLVDPVSPIPNVDYVAFTSHRQEGLNVWRQVPTNFSHENRTKIARFYKTHSRLFFPNHRYAVWVDANIELTHELPKIIDDMAASEAPIAAISHPLRQCLYDEIRVCAAREKDDPDTLFAQSNDYREREIPENLGLFETGVMLFSHFDERAAACANSWWEEISRFSTRDQVSLPVALYERQCPMYELLPIGDTVRTGKGFSIRPHKRYSDSTTRAVDSYGVYSVEARSIDTDAIVPIFNNPDMTIECIERLRSFENLKQLLLVDDCSEPANRQKIVEYANAKNLTLTLNETNLGYSASVNSQFKHVKSPSVFLVNTDTLPTAEVMTNCNSVLFSNDKFGAVGCFSNAASFQSIPNLKNENNQFDSNLAMLDLDSETVAEWLAEFFDKQDFMFTPLLNGFFYCVKTKALHTVGGFDLENFGVFGEENDFVFRLQDAGYHTLLSTKSYVPHNKAAGYRSVDYDVKAAKKVAGTKLRKKWGERVQESESALNEDLTLQNLRDFISNKLQEYR